MHSGIPDLPLSSQGMTSYSKTVKLKLDLEGILEGEKEVRSREGEGGQKPNKIPYSFYFMHFYGS